jgi:hypothetical protein
MLQYNTSHVVGSSYLTIDGVSVIGIIGGSHGSEASDYTVSSTTAHSAAGSASITPKALTVSLDNTGVTKEYDGTADARGVTALYRVTGLVDADERATVSATGTLAYNTSHVEGSSYLTIDGVSVTDISGSKHGSLLSDYSLLYTSAQSAAGSGTIMPKLLTLIDVKVSGKVYDATQSAMVMSSKIDGLVAGESLGITNYTALFDTKNAGIDKTVSVVKLIFTDGVDGLARDYSYIEDSGTATATINAKVIDLVGIKIDDGSSDFAASNFGDNGIIKGVGSETVTLTGKGTVPSASVLDIKQPLNLGDLQLNDGTNGGLGSNYTLIGGNHYGTIVNSLFFIPFNLHLRELENSPESIMRRRKLQSTKPDEPLISAGNYVFPFNNSF